MPSKSEAILSSHRDAASRVTAHFSEKHKLNLKPNDALDVVALVLGAPNWKTLRAMAEQGRAPRMVDIGAAEPAPLVPHILPQHRKAGVYFAAKPVPTTAIVAALEARNKGFQPPFPTHWGEGVAYAEKRLDLQLSPEQRRAVEELVAHQFTMLMGAPGTGKDICVEAFIVSVQYGGGQVLDARRGGDAMASAIGLQDNIVMCHEQNPLQVDAVVLNESSFESPYVLDALLSALPAACRVVLVTGPGLLETPRTKGPAAIFAALRDSPKVHRVELSQVLRQPQIIREYPNPAADVAKELLPRVQRLVLIPQNWVALVRDMETALAVRLTHSQLVSFDTMAASSLTFVAGDDKSDAGSTVRLFASVMGKAEYNVYDAVGTGDPAALLRTILGQDRVGNQVVAMAGKSTADVVLLDERSFGDLELLRQVLTMLKPDCRVVVLFSQWWPHAANAEEVVSALHMRARGQLAPVVFTGRGAVQKGGGAPN